VSITRRDEAQQRRFVKDYLAAGAPVDSTFWNGKILDPVTGFGILVQYNVWAEEATIAEIERLHRQSPRPDDVLYRLGHQLVMSGSLRAFETIRTKYRDHPQYELYITQCIYRNLNTKISQPFDVIYRALESDEAVIRDPARAHAGLMFEHPLPRIEEAWAKALVRRYGHEPTDLEILKDPVAEEIRLRNPGLSLSTIPRVRGLAKQAAAKR
jgi:hypothetical protein